MKIIKKIKDECKDDKKAIFIFNSINNIMKKYNFPLNFDMLKIIIGKKNKIFIDKNDAYIFFDIDSIPEDEKSIEFLLMHKISHVYTKKFISKDVPHFIQDIIANRELVKKGYGSSIAHYYFTKLANNPVNNIHDFLDMNMPKIIFEGKDEHDFRMFENLVSKIDYNKDFLDVSSNFIATVKKDLHDNNNLDKAAIAYHKLTKGDFLHLHTVK